MLAVEITSTDFLDYEGQLDSFWRAEVSTLCQLQAGLPVDAELGHVYEEFADLFSAEQVHKLIGASRIDADSQLRHLAAFAALRYLRQVSLPYEEALGRQLGAATLSWRGETWPYYASGQLLSREEDASCRQLLYQKRSEIVSSLNPILQERWQTIHAHVKQLGFDSYYLLCDELRGLKLENLEFMAQTFLRETAVPYFRALSYWSQLILGVSQPDAADMFYLLQGSQFDHLFPAEKLQTAVYDTAHMMGLPLAGAAGLEMDLESRLGKSPRPFCAFVHVPDDIKLVINPVGGHQDYKAVFHELGHALHGLHIPAQLPFARRCLGDDSVGEAFAFVFEHLPTNPIWLRELMGAADYTTYVDYMRFVRLLFVRRCAAKVLYENQLHVGLSDPAEFYTAVLHEHLGLNISPAYYLLDVDDGFYNAHYFRAWILAAQLVAWLEAQLGKEWMCSSAAGASLKTLWPQGQPAAEFVSLLIGEKRLSPDALIRSFVA
jgi:hypothetical protein